MRNELGYIEQRQVFVLRGAGGDVCVPGGKH